MVTATFFEDIEFVLDDESITIPEPIHTVAFD